MEEKRQELSEEVRKGLTAGQAALAAKVGALLAADVARVRVSEGFVEKLMTAARAPVKVGPATARYQRMVELENLRFRKFVGTYWKWLSACAAAAVVVLSLSAYWYFKPPASDRALIEAALRSADPSTRHRQRLEAAEFMTEVVNGQADVGGLIPDGPVYLVGQRDDDTGEICIFAYQADQWNALDEMLGKRGDMVLKEAWAAMHQRARVSRVQNGRLGIPDDLWQEYLDGTDTASLLKFADRNEMWEPRNLAEYRRGTVILRPHPDWQNL